MADSNQNMQLLHLCVDSLFNEMIIDQFESVNPHQNRYVFVSEGINPKFRLNDSVTAISKTEFLEIKDQYKYVFAHSLNQNNTWACSKLQNHVVIWGSWGGDLIGAHNYLSDEVILEPETLKISNRLRPRLRKSLKQRLYNWFEKSGVIHKWYYYLRTGEHHPNYLRKMAYANIDYISTVLPSEVPTLRYLNGLKAEYHWFNYAHLPSITEKFYGRSPLQGHGIIVGHSAFFSSNHTEVFDKLAQLNLDCPVFVPLAYGYEDYRQVLIDHATSLLGDNVEFQVDPVPSADYLDKFAQHHVLILNTKRQEAVGTLLIGLYLGMRVYLNKRGLLFQFCIDHDLIVFAVDDLNNDLVNSPLPMEQIEVNRAKLEEIYGKESVLLRLKKLLEKIDEQ